MQYRGNDNGNHRGRVDLRAGAGRLVALRRHGPATGDKFADGGIEIDRTTPRLAARNVRCSPRSRTSSGPGSRAQMTYYETARGAKVFAAGAFTLAGSALRPDASAVLDNLWARMANG